MYNPFQKLLKYYNPLTLEEAYNKGMKDKFNDIPIGLNPFRPYTQEYYAWNAGYTDVDSVSY